NTKKRTFATPKTKAFPMPIHNYSINKFLPLLCLILLLASCREEVENEFDDFPAAPVVNSILIAGEPIRVHLSLTTKINSTDFHLIDNARVLLYVDNTFAEELTYQEEGIYEAMTLAEPQKEYACQIITPDFDTIFCQNRIPATQSILDLKFIPVAGLDEEGLPHPGIELTFENDPSQNLYYEVALRHFQYGEEQYVNILPNNDPIIVREGVNIPIFSNEGITGDSYKLHLNFMTSGYSSSVSEQKLVVELRSVNYAYYQYVKTRKLYEQGYYSSALESFPPMSLYSNVRNGYGIFAGYTFVQSDTIYFLSN
ncbi:DUF4249 domain-containing protein, partial [Bacteroidales bacterium OttesenSCG-928-B11]|nr:DUF4249 domain-containing protein [Bacteroidales bacterium OttesenSCG-928-B11]